MLKLNNPGNIRVSKDTFIGEVVPSHHPSFKTFKTMEHGYRAMFVVLRTYIHRHGCNTIRKIIQRWAPPSENSTEKYVQAVCRLMEIDEETPIVFQRDMMLSLAKAVSWIENGQRADEEEVCAGWALL